MIFFTVVLSSSSVIAAVAIALLSWRVPFPCKNDGKNRHGPKMAFVIRNVNRMSYLFQSKQLLHPHKHNPLTYTYIYGIRVGVGVGMEADRGRGITV